MLEAKSVSHKGNVRERNEDALIANEDCGLWVVADGVGGNASGDVASALATQTIDRKMRQGASLNEAILAANEAILDAAMTHSEYQSMATTVVACRFEEAHFELAWIGDSRAYLIDHAGISQLSSDHNVANELFLHGEIESHEVDSHPGQHELTQALGQLSIEKVPVSIGDLHHGDCLLLCTDGLSGVISEQDIVKTIKHAPSLNAACDSLLDQVLEAGAPDNVTFTLVRYLEDQPTFQATDFEGKSYRAAFDRRSYIEHCRNRPILFAIIFISIAILFFCV